MKLLYAMILAAFFAAFFVPVAINLLFLVSSVACYVKAKDMDYPESWYLAGSGFFLVGLFW